jgi:hypothetical protein
MERDRLRRARATPHVPDEPVDERLVVRPGRCESKDPLGQVLAVAPALADLAQFPPPLLVPHRPRVIRRPEAARRRVVEDERTGALGVRRGEQQRDARALVGGPEHGALGPGSLHDRADVVHARLEGRDLADRVRQAATALVEQQNPPGVREPAHMVDEERLIPRGQQVGQRAAHEDDVERALPDNLVCDRDVAAARVLDVRDVHPSSVS